jgi:peroxiredoxin
MELSNVYDKLGENFEIVGIFPSEIEHLRKHTNKHTSKFPILSDCYLKYYRKFSVKKSILGMIKGIVFPIPTLWKSMKAGNVPLEISSRVLIMPLSLLVDEKGIVQEIYHGKDEGDHIPIDRVVEFSKAVSEPLGGANGIPPGGMP